MIGGFEVGFLGGPSDGETLCIPSRNGEIGPPREYPVSELSYSPTCTPQVTTVTYFLRVNEADDGPLWFYVRDPEAASYSRFPFEPDAPVVKAAETIAGEKV